MLEPAARATRDAGLAPGMEGGCRYGRVYAGPDPRVLRNGSRDMSTHFDIVNTPTTGLHVLQGKLIYAYKT